MKAAFRHLRHTASCAVLLVLGLLSTAHADTDPQNSKLRVCADPNNLPFSNRKGEGFENRLALMLADAMDRKLEYVWHPQRRGFLRNTLYAGRCDLVMGMPAGLEGVRTSSAYYRSSYVFVYPSALQPDIDSFDDARLRDLRIGIHLVGDDGSNTPPELALAARGIVDNVVGYMIQGNYAEQNPPARLVEAVADGSVDIAALWGPTAGYFASKQSRPLTVTMLQSPAAPFSFAIAMGTRPEDTDLLQQVDAILMQSHKDIDALLRSYGVPLLPLQAGPEGNIHD